MALQRDTKYPGRFTTGDTAHPQGAFKNRTTPDAQDGSYLEAQWLNDWDGFFASLLSQAGLTPNGNVDAVGASQYFTALQDLVSRGDYVTAGGTANAITLTHTAPITSYRDGQVFRFRPIAANTDTTTINVDGLGAVTLYGSTDLACQGGEISLNGYAVAVYSSVLGGVVLLACTGGALQVANASKSKHALNLSLFAANLLGAGGYIKIPVFDANTNTLKYLIIQWGSTSITFNNTTVADRVVTFPITFPSVCMYVKLSQNGGVANGSGMNVSEISQVNSGFNAIVATSGASYSSQPFRYIAIGW